MKVNNYSIQKEHLIRNLNNAKSKVEELSKYDMDVSKTINKFDGVIEKIKEDVISVVLVGAFSDGKTSVVSGWMNEKLDNMKISSDESSNEILCYKPSSLQDGCQIVDTPGLFGDKTSKDENGSKILLSDMTKQYISEADLILYVVAAKNPIKDSHKECIRWILKDLNKLSSTIFVINRMDEVADLTDDEDFCLQVKVKTENVRNKLLECGLNSSEANSVNIVCVSAAPEGKDIEKWKDYYEEYVNRSRIDMLEEKTNNILSKSKNTLISKTANDVINDEIGSLISSIDGNTKEYNKIVIPELKDGVKRNNIDLKHLENKISRSKDKIKDELKALEKRKINAIRSATVKEFKQVLEDEIGLLDGNEGYVLDDNINDILNHYAERFYKWTSDINAKIQKNEEKKITKELISKGTAGLKSVGNLKPGTIKNVIFKGRDLLNKSYKFKPWQVTKMANFASKSLPVIGAGIDVAMSIIENISAEKKNRKFEESKDNIADQVRLVFKQLYDLLNDDNLFNESFAPDYIELKNELQNNENNISRLEDNVKKINEWVENVNINDYLT